jgi:NAD+---dinitrogen-reductase ADP-D-ribosyltransferase
MHQMHPAQPQDNPSGASCIVPLVQASYNHCEWSPWYLASADFNSDPRPIHILGVRRENRFLFDRLEATENSNRRGEIFNEYMSVKFHLHEWEQYQTTARRCLRNNYIKFIRNWGCDSNSVSGAVLKSWVASRIGIEPSFHREPILRESGMARYHYQRDAMQGTTRTSAIYLQLDLLFEYCQYELERRLPGKRWITLYRGTHDPDEYEVIDEQSPREHRVRLNNLSSFTSDRERAWEFGSTVWKVKVPAAKVFFFSGLLPDRLLKGEDEYIVIGGDYQVETLLY